MPQQPQGNPSQLAQDKDFVSAVPEDQIKYLSAQDPEFAKTPREDQMGYLGHILGKPEGWGKGAKAGDFTPAKEQQPGMLEKADTAITSTLATNPENLKSAVKTNMIEAPKTLGREVYSGGKAAASMVDPRPYYHAATAPAEPDEPLSYGGPMTPDPFNRLAYRMIVKPVMNAGRFYYDAAKGKYGDAPQVESTMLNEAPESVGQGAGAVVGGKLMSEFGPKAVSGARALATRIAPATVNAFNSGRGALAQKIVGPLAYENVGETAADVRTGANPERGIVDEGLVGTTKSLVGKADTRLGELKQAANNILDNHPNARQIINAEPMVDQAIDEAVKEAQKVGGDTGRLEALRKAVKTQYGKLQGTPREMNDLKADLQDHAQGLGAYKNTQPLEASAARALGDIARRVKDAVNAKVPEAAELNQRMQDLADARQGIQRKVNQARGEDIFQGGHPLANLGRRTIGAAPVRTAAARMLNFGNVKSVPEPMTPPAQPLIRGLLPAKPTPLGPSTMTSPSSPPSITYPFRGVGRATPKMLTPGPIQLRSSMEGIEPASPPPHVEATTRPQRFGRLLPERGSGRIPLREYGYTSPEGAGEIPAQPKFSPGKKIGEMREMGGNRWMWDGEKWQNATMRH